jgi:hypothetical protein
MGRTGRRARRRGRIRHLDLCALGWSRSSFVSTADATLFVDRFGFSWSVPFRCASPRFWGLEKLGFPWILSPELRLINELQEIFRQKIFLAGLSSRKRPGNGRPKQFGARKEWTVHGASLALFLIFCKNLSRTSGDPEATAAAILRLVDATTASAFAWRRSASHDQRALRRAAQHLGPMGGSVRRRPGRSRRLECQEPSRIGFSLKVFVSAQAASMFHSGQNPSANTVA